MPSLFSRSCLQCGVRQLGGFCSLADEPLAKLSMIGKALHVKAGDSILVEGYPSDRLYIVCSGQVKITLTNRSGRVLILRVATPGDVLGLAASLRHLAYDSSAVAIEDCELKSMTQSEFASLMSEFGEVAENSVRTLAGAYSSAVLSARRLALSGSAAGKLASVLLDWAHRVSHDPEAPRFMMPLTHEELGNMAGISRETTTRLLGRFRQEGWISQENSNVCIRNRQALERLFS